ATTAQARVARPATVSTGAASRQPVRRSARCSSRCSACSAPASPPPCGAAGSTPDADPPPGLPRTPGSPEYALGGRGALLRPWVVTPPASTGRTATMTESNESRTWYEEFKVSSDNLVAKVRELIREGNVRRVFIKNESGETLLEIPLTAGVAVTAITTVFAPVLVAVGAIAALLTQVTVGVERRVPAEDDGSDEIVVDVLDEEQGPPRNQA